MISDYNQTNKKRIEYIKEKIENTFKFLFFESKINF